MKLNRQIGVTTRARPIRVCYLVPLADEANDMLTKIFAEAYSRWGGRNTLVVPMLEGQITDVYMTWMRSFDPDLIYSYGPLSDELYSQIDRTLMPASIQIHRQVDNQPPNHWPHLDMQGIASLSVLPALKVMAGNLAPRITAVVDAYPFWYGDGFVADSFGLRRSSPGRTMAWPMDTQVADFATSLALVPPDAPENRNHMPKADREVSSDSGLLRMMANDGTIVTMATLSGAFHDINVPHNFHAWNRSLTLVIGDSPTDRICFWNSRLLYPTWLLNGLCPLRIPEARLDDIGFLDALIPFIQRRNWLNATGGGANQIALRSASVAQDRLDALAARLRQATHVWVNVEPIGSTADCVPTAERLAEPVAWKADPPTHFVSDAPFVIECPRPRHLHDVAPVPPRLRLGHWGMDTRIERHDTQSAFSNVVHWWKLPRRRELLHQFTTKGRVNCDGELSVFPNERGEPLERETQAKFDVPASDELAVMSLFIRDPFVDRPRHADVPIQRPYSGVQVWDKGRYLTGLAGLFGSLAQAYQVLAVRYWQTTFLEMASPSRNQSEERKAQVLAALKASYRRKQRKETIDDENDWGALTDAVIKVAPGKLKAPEAIITYQRLLQLRRADLNVVLDAEQNLHAQRDEIAAECEDELKSALEARCLQGILTQGHRWTCRRCSHTNWVSTSSIGPILQCEVCRTQMALPADFRWHFYLNDFLAEGLREHGMLGLVWCLGQLQWRARESFFFAPPLALFHDIPRDRRAAPNKEVDICCALDGHFVIGEVKETARDINNALGDDLVQLATDVRADKVVLACMDRAAARTVQQQIERISGRLAEIGCEAEGMVPDNMFGAGSHYLP